MNTTSTPEANMTMARNYYAAMVSGDTTTINNSLDIDVKYIDPIWPLQGKTEVMPAAANLAGALENITFGPMFNSDTQVMFSISMHFKETENPETKVPLNTAVIMTFGGGLITQIELFYDTVQVTELCKTIFTY